MAGFEDRKGIYRLYVRCGNCRPTKARSKQTRTVAAVLVCFYVRRGYSLAEGESIMPEDLPRRRVADGGALRLRQATGSACIRIVPDTG